MRCPFCGNEDTQVKDSRPAEDNSAIRRRRSCTGCGQRFTTVVEAGQAIAGLAINQVEELWKSCWEYRSFIAKFCTPVFLPLTLSTKRKRYDDEKWRVVVSERLRTV